MTSASGSVLTNLRPAAPAGARPRGPGPYPEGTPLGPLTIKPRLRSGKPNSSHFPAAFQPLQTAVNTHKNRPLSPFRPESRLFTPPPPCYLPGNGRAPDPLPRRPARLLRRRRPGDQDRRDGAGEVGRPGLRPPRDRPQPLRGRRPQGQGRGLRRGALRLPPRPPGGLLRPRRPQIRPRRGRGPQHLVRRRHLPPGLQGPPRGRAPPRERPADGDDRPRRPPRGHRHHGPAPPGRRPPRRDPRRRRHPRARPTRSASPTSPRPPSPSTTPPRSSPPSAPASPASSARTRKTSATPPPTARKPSRPWPPRSTPSW